MLTWPDIEHDLVICEYSAHGKRTTGKGLPKNQNIRVDRFMIAGQHLTCAAEPCLYLVGNKKDICFATDSCRLSQISFVRNDNTGLALNRFYKEAGNVFICNGFL